MSAHTKGYSVAVKLFFCYVAAFLKLACLSAALQTSDPILETDVIEYETVAGNKAELPCNTSLWTSEKVALVLWYKGSSGIPIYTLDARNASSLSHSTHILAKELEERAYFDTSANPPVLRIDALRVDDEDEYRCRVDYRKSRTQNSLLNLTVIVPPTAIKITDAITSETLEGIVGPYDEGDDLYFICDAFGGKPSPAVIWYDSDNNVIDNEYIESDEFVRNKLHIKKLSRTDLMSKFWCRASSSPTTAPLKETSITVDINLRPVVLTMSNKNKAFVAGRRSELQCESSGSRPPARINWWKGSQRLSDVKESVSADGNITFSSLSLTPSVNDNGKQITCKAENVEMKKSGIEEQLVLNVQYAPQLTMALGAKIDRNAIKEGSDVYFECTINANPWVSEVLWIFEGSTLFSDPSSGIIISNQSLVLQKVKRQNRGRYWCVAVNTEGTGKSDPFYLKVLFSPDCKPGQKIIYGVARNELIHISCQVNADPEDVTFKWLLNNSMETVEIRSFVSNGSSSVASYMPRSRFGYGSILCWGHNIVGVQKEACVYNVVPASPPEAVHNCSLRNQSLTSLHLICEPGDNGGLRQIFFLEVYNSDLQRLHLNTTAMDVPDFVIQSLPSSTKFTLNVYAANAKGRSASFSLSTATLSPPQKEAKLYPNEELIVSPIVGILIGVIATTSLIFLVAVVCVKQRSSNRSRRPKDSENAKKSSSPRLYSKNEAAAVNRIDLNRDSMHANNGYLKSPLQAMYSDTHRGTLGHYGQQESLSAGMPFKGITVPDVTDVTYAELSLLPCHTMASISRKMPGKPEPCEYASIHFNVGKCVAKEDVAFDELKRRESPIADGCSETEVSIETPLIETLRPGYRSHDIIIRRLSPSNPRTATPV